MNDLTSLYAQIEELVATIATEKDKTLKGNKASGGRSRKAAMSLSKLLKLFRKETMAKKEEVPA